MEGFIVVGLFIVAVILFTRKNRKPKGGSAPKPGEDIPTKQK